jgi:hypothetical protein
MSYHKRPEKDTINPPGQIITRPPEQMYYRSTTKGPVYLRDVIKRIQAEEPPSRDRELLKQALEALEHVTRRLQMDIDDGGRPDHWSMLDLTRKTQPAISAIQSHLKDG